MIGGFRVAQWVAPRSLLTRGPYLSCIGFGTSHDFRKSGFAAPTQGHSITLRENLTVVYSNIFMVILLPHKLLSFPFLPKKLSDLGQALEEYKRYMVEMVEQEKKLLTQRAPGTGKPNQSPTSRLITVTNAADLKHEDFK